MKIVYTKIAAGLLGDSRAAMEEQLRGELAELFEECEGGVEGGLDDGFMHVCTYGGRDYFCAPVRNADTDARAVGVDLCDYIEVGDVKHGPLAGKAVIMPTPVTGLRIDRGEEDDGDEV